MREARSSERDEARGRLNAEAAIIELESDKGELRVRVRVRFRVR